MGKRGPKKIYTEEERKYRRTESVKKSRKRYRRCEMEMFPSTLDRLKEIKNRLGVAKGIDRLTWNDCMHHVASFIEMHNENFFNFAKSNRTADFTPSLDESPSGGYDSAFLPLSGNSPGCCEDFGDLSSSPGLVPDSYEQQRVLPSIAEALGGVQ